MDLRDKETGKDPGGGRNTDANSGKGMTEWSFAFSITVFILV
jgi:hypothetical protein